MNIKKLSILILVIALSSFIFMGCQEDTFDQFEPAEDPFPAPEEPPAPPIDDPAAPPHEDPAGPPPEGPFGPPTE